ncbi:MAG: rod shape-determining protein MreD [Clostridium sp.]|jgi:rod shape-determining protein MreD|uniref:rod shape-determining protein MreD n=1 Tax=Clostridium sp. TaxID=1506 RepID=UPI0025BCFA6B|nr:rod shape-determining protein MreD [Clostridium sp.]MCH3964734.1 rod shape-determining protein MreD [Clostridium sp.]MCI1715205.1 rod shape-determining protein MreD [Clostridium sp.]MCI1799467.1 rod shape-determining protein MreD [Clostridium sp.]MCI1813388.1 rod shape-determining protein MreD [Clostridium sp.]MCI1870279.1 rod shape-determining protein MreD [Clostridium sp.]
MKKILILFSLSIILFILDNAVVPFFSIKTIYPSLIFVFAISYSIISGSYEGLWLGVFTGILQDIYFIDGFWINSFVNMIICVIGGFIGSNIFREKKFIPVISCFFLSVLKGMMLFVILWLSGAEVNMVNIFFTSIYNMVVCIFMYNMVYKLCRKSYMISEWKF